MSLVPAPAAGHGTSAFGNIRVTQVPGGDRWLLLPTGTQGNRQLLLALSINDEERNVINMPSRDIQVRITGNVNIQQFIAGIIRRQGYFLAILVQSRGRAAIACGNKCATTANPRFQGCFRIPTFQGGACAECVWQSHGARCTHRGRNVDSSDDPDEGGDDSDSSDNGGGGPGPSNYRKPRADPGEERTSGYKTARTMKGYHIGGSAAQPMVVDEQE
ncbi:hypothetical protein ColLi_06284 [Colletotrichum liriopes]|uniref:Uncharacterized protein n=1 Tax=Colletotrichum liriopes TaxID=708192 RepID=A0AA37GLX5_9PEZI|nr:hypothetical protein ColLi_06284 [Colletotrichum liriopes]